MQKGCENMLKKPGYLARHWKTALAKIIGHLGNEHCVLTPFKKCISKLHEEVSVLATMKRPAADQLFCQNQPDKLDEI